jgi:hypothetical protein
MSDIRDPHPDSPPEADNDRRSDVEQAIDAPPEDVEHGPAVDGEETPLEPPGAYDGNSGTGGVTKNQDLTAR